LNGFPKRLFRVGKRKSFELLDLPAYAAGQDYELTKVSDKNETVFGDILFYLIALNSLTNILAWRFDLNHAAISDHEKRMILRDNAIALLGLSNEK
jgi:hypothetical protein